MVNEIEVLKLLLNHKHINISARTIGSRIYGLSYNKTALDIARENGYKEIVELLLAHGAIDDFIEQNSPTDFAPTPTENTMEDPNESEFPEFPEIECVMSPGLDMDMEIERVREKEMGLEMEMRYFGDDGDDDEH